MALRYASVRAGLAADVSRAIAMATGGALAFGLTEYVLALIANVDIAFASKVRMIALVATLAIVLWTLLVVGLVVALVVGRLVRAHIRPPDGRDLGWFAPTAITDGVRRGVPHIWGAVAAMLVTAGIVQRGAVWAMTTYKEQQLTAVLIALIAIGAALVALAIVYRWFVVAVTAGGIALAPLLGGANPLGRWRSCGVALGAAAIAAIWGAYYAFPQYRSVIPTKLVTSGVVIALGCGLGAHVHHAPPVPADFRLRATIALGAVAAIAATYFGSVACGATTVLAVAVVAFAADTIRRSRRDRTHGLALASAGLVLLVGTFVSWGADLETRYAASTASPALEKLIGVVRVANDVDRDGFGSLLGDVDCAPFDSSIHPGAYEKIDDTVDRDCDGEIVRLSKLVLPPGPKVPVPADFKKNWNFLFITIDDLRYDHTTFGGYASQPAHRDTTPNLAKLVARSTSFDFCNAPSAGTMASIPAILTSKFFHSGIALDETTPGLVVPKIKPENTTLPEIMKRGGYVTGVIGSHEWWNDWGLDQGVDEYDNTIGKTPDPFRVAADKTTNKILAWIARHQGQKFFLWAHYIDPHGRYVAHPDVVDWGNDEPDLYDAEIKWTDQEVGRLLDELVHIPSTKDTIIVITSDHGDSMAEHNVPLGTHGTALNRELLHVPMIFYIPGNGPHHISGAVTNLDIVPTIADLAGIDTSDLQFEGRSDIGALFYGTEDRERIVYAETNAPYMQRAAISEAWKLIYHIKPNFYELFDLKADPWEHKNLAPSEPPMYATMRSALQAWIARVLHSRDPVFNQAYKKLGEIVLTAPPQVAVKTERQTLADGAIEILGIGSKAPLAAGANDIYVYLHAIRPTQIRYTFALQAWQTADPTAELTAPSTGPTASTPPRATGDGDFATDQWRANDYIREKFTIQIPADWHGAVTVALVATDRAGERAHPTGDAPANDPFAAVLGRLALP